MHNTKGDLIGHNDFVFGGGNLASSVAQLICEVAVKAAGEQERQPAKKTKNPNGQSI